MKTLGFVVVVIVVVGAGAGLYYEWQARRSAISSLAPTPENGPQAQATPQYPVDTENESSLPDTAGGQGASAENHQPLEESLKDLFGQEALSALFNIDDIPRRVVVTVDNLVGPNLPNWNLSPLKPLDSDFAVSQKDGKTIIAPTNAQRYTPYVNLARDVDARKLVGLYVRFYPLFQTAYRDLGFSRYFNDRLVEVIDNILKTPEVSEPVEVVQPTKHNKYKFADERLENLSTGQKILLRMGNENARVVKVKLRQIRMLLVHLRGKIKHAH